jgi:predicted enzyme related to lactoylglutathione lyase
VSYLRIAVPDPARSAAFYNAVFGWTIRKGSTAFEDGTGHIMPDLPVASEAGVQQLADLACPGRQKSVL